MTVIYLDTLFLLNTIIDYLLLLCTAKVAGSPLHRMRYGFGALLGGLYAVAIFFPNLGFLSQPFFRILVAVLMVFISFGGHSNLLRKSLIFFALSCGFGGGVFAISMLGGDQMSLYGGVIYSVMDLKIVLLSASICYVVLTVVFRRYGRHMAMDRELVPVKISMNGRHVTLIGLVDTGNTLTDPINGCPVLVVDATGLSGIFPEGQRLSPYELSHPLSTMEKWSDFPLAHRFRLLPYRAVGIDRGMLLAMRVDRVEVNGVLQAGVLVALSPSPVSDGGRYRVLVGIAH